MRQTVTPQADGPLITTRWSLRLSVRTRDFHSLKRSSTLLGTTNNKKIRNGKPQIICKRIRQTASRRLHNRYYAKTMRNAVRKLRATTDKAAATELLPKVQKMLDKLAKKNIIHKNKAANIKSGVMAHINKLA